MNTRDRLVFVVLALLTASVPLVAQTRGVTADDYLSFEFLADPHFSPDGSTIAYVVTTIDRKQNRRHSDVWTTPADGSREPAALTASPQSSNSPRWSPDGTTLAFLRRGSGGGSGTGVGEPQTDSRPLTLAQVWLLPLAGGEPRPLTNLLNGVSAFAWSPDGTRLVCVGRSGPSDTAKSPSDVRHYTHITYKFNDTGWFDDRRTHLWVVTVASGAATQNTSGDDWNDSDPQWSPDGTKIAFVSDRTGKAFDESRDTDVWVIDAAGGTPTKIWITCRATARHAGRRTAGRSRSSAPCPNARTRGSGWRLPPAAPRRASPPNRSI